MQKFGLFSKKHAPFLNYVFYNQNANQLSQKYLRAQVGGVGSVYLYQKTCMF